MSSRSQPVQATFGAVGKEPDVTAEERMNQFGTDSAPSADSVSHEMAAIPTTRGTYDWELTEGSQ